MISELPAFTVLSGIGYNVSVHEGLVVFEESKCMFGHHQRLAFHRTDDKGGGCWYLQTDSTYGRTSVSHILRAYELVCEVYGKNFEEKKPL